MKLSHCCAPTRDGHPSGNRGHRPAGRFWEAPVSTLATKPVSRPAYRNATGRRIPRSPLYWYAIRKLSFGTSLPAGPEKGVFLDDAMHQRVDPLGLRGMENLEAVLAVSDQPSLIKGHPLAHECLAIPLQPLQIGRGILREFQRLQIELSGPLRRNVRILEEIPHSSIYQLARA